MINDLAKGNRRGTKKNEQGLIRVRNKPSRIDEVAECLNRILESGVIDSESLPSYLEKLQFAEVQLWAELEG